jgi:amidase
VSGVWGRIDEAAPRATGASDAFKVLRAAESWVKFGELVESHEKDLTESFVWNVRQGRDITAEAYLRAEMVRSRTYRAFQEFFEKYDILMLPAASVLPFPNSQGEVTEIDGRPCETIIDYLACTYLVSLVGFPAISLPALWTEQGIPFGVQLVARPDHEATLLHTARALEDSVDFRHRWPALPGER